MSLNSVSKRRKTNADSINEVNKTEDSSGSCSVTLEFPVSQDAVGIFIDIFTEDILPEIFDNLGILTANDLLNFRLVNRCWRNAATSVLLKQNVCEIALGLCRVKTLLSKSYKYFNVKHPGLYLSDLCQLISTSPKFPSTSIRFHKGCELGFGNLDPKSDLNEKKEHQKELFRFFSLYGQKMRKLSFWSRISKQAVLNLLYVHMPHLTCLDLEDFDKFSMSDQDQGHICLPPRQSALELREIVVGSLSYINSNFLKEIGKVSPNLTSIIQTRASSLGAFLDMGTTYLIKEFYFDPRPAQLSTFQEVVATGITRGIHQSLKIRKLIVGFTHLKKYSDSDEYNEEYEVVLKVLNIILSAIKNSIKHLEFRIDGLDIPINVFIPPLPHLEYLGLLDSWESSCTPRFFFLGDVIGEAILAGELTADESPYNFEALALRNQVNQNRNIPVGYFPRLCKVDLRIEKRRYNNPDPDKIMGFFSMDRFRADMLLTVTSLELGNSHHTQHDIDNMSNIFPNVSHFRSLRDCSLFHQHHVWTMFPKLDRFEILVPKEGLDMNLVDSFFTGMYPRYCALLDSDYSSDLKTYPVRGYERFMPYIGDCKNLKEIQLRFCTKLTSRFVSKVTALHGFKHVISRTKIIFSFEPVTMNANEIKETHRYLEDVAPYVEIRLQKQ